MIVLRRFSVSVIRWWAHSETLLCPKTFPQSLFLISLMNFVSKIEQIRSSLDPDRPIPADTVKFHGTLFADIQLLTDDCVKAVFKEMPSKKSCELDPVLLDCLEEITPIVADIIKISWSSSVVPQCFKHALAKPLLKKANLDLNCLKNYHPVSSLPFLSKVLSALC